MNKHTAELLEQHFDTAFAAPDGLAKLRELILTLAMQGKLVEQDPNDPPASELLKEIEAEKQRLTVSSSPRRRGSSKSLPPIDPQKVPYELPQGWVWVRLGMIAEVNGGFAFKSSKYSNVGVRVVRISDFDERGFKDDKIVRYPYSDDLSGFSLDVNNILMAMTGGTVGKSLLVKSLPEPMVVNQRVATIKMATGVVPEFINGLIRTYLIQSVIHEAKNSTNDNISMGDITGFLVPLPALPEQHRIVARIDQLMARCDELEKLRKEREEKRLAVHAAATKQLLDAPDGSACDFIHQHFGELYTVKENVAELRKVILQLAVMGRLVPQDAGDPPASELLKEIEAEKLRLVKAGKIKKPKPLPPIKPEEVPYDLPQGWEWVRLDDISLSSDSGWSPQCLPEQRSQGQWGVLKVSAVSWGKFNPDENKALPSDKAPRPECEVKAGDFLLSRANTDDLVARSVIVEETPEMLMMSDKIVRFQLSPHISKHYVNVVNGVDFSRTYYISNASGTSSSMKNVSRKVMAELPVPLPPINEQHRIVARIDQLMVLCDTLEQQIDAATHKQTRLLGAVMAQV